MKNKITIFICLSLMLICIFSPVHHSLAQNSPGTLYHLLQPLPGLPDFNPDAVKDPHALGTYLNIIIKLFIGLCAVLAVVMIVIGGVEYMTSELISGKEAGKERIRGALFGLLLALAAWTILYQINPDLLNTDVEINPATLQVTISDLGIENLTTPFKPIAGNKLESLGISCPGGGGSAAVTSIGQSFIGKSSYDQSRRNTTSGGTAYVDCSAFVSQVYVCAGLPNPGGTTVGIFNSSGSVSVNSVSPDGTSMNGIPLKPGDLIGWLKGGRENNGHVMMYIGNGQMIDAQPDRYGGVAVRSVRQYLGRIRYVKRV